MSTDNSIVLLDEARARLAKVASVDDAKKIRDQAAAMEHYARQQKGALDAANKASEIKVRAERRIGELLKAVPRVEPKEKAKRAGEAGGRGRPKATSHHGDKLTAEVVIRKTPLQAVIEKAEITPRMAEDCQKLAAIPEPMFEAAVVTMQTDPDIAHRGVSTAGMLRVYRDSDGSVESIKKAVNREIKESPDVQYAGAISRLLKDVQSVVDVLSGQPFAKWPKTKREQVSTELRLAIRGLSQIAKEIAP